MQRPLDLAVKGKVFFEEYSLKMDEQMLTPAQKYRQALTGLNPHQRQIVRLEHRWHKNLPKWEKAAIEVQRFTRGCIARDHVALLKEEAHTNRLKLEHVATALASLRRKKFTQAIEEAAVALQLNPQCFEAFRIRGHAKLALALELRHSRKKNPIDKQATEKQTEKEAYLDTISEYSQALAIEENHVEVRLARARCYLSVEDWKTAEEDIEYLMDIDPRTSLYWRLRGILRSKLCLWSGAAEDFSKSIELGDTSCQAYIHRGMAEGSAQLWFEADRSFTEALNIDECSVSAFVMRGRIRCCQRRWDLAEEDFKHALSLNPDCTDAKTGLKILNIPHIPLPLSETE